MIPGPTLTCEGFCLGGGFAEIAQQRVRETGCLVTNGQKGPRLHPTIRSSARDCARLLFLF